MVAPDAIGPILDLHNLVLVAGQGADIWAYSQSGEPDDGSEGLEIFAFDCHPTAWGTGMADALMGETCGVLSTAASRAVLWTPSGAARAQRFYERRGFVRTGRGGSRPSATGSRRPPTKTCPSSSHARPLG